MKTISIVVPVFNEEETAPEFYRRLRAALQKDFAPLKHQVIFVDDGSKDGSFALLRDISRQDPEVQVIRLSRNFGHHIAITAGLDAADGDYVVMMDGDLQDQPEEIVKLFRKLEEGHDVVYARRVAKKFGARKRFCSWLFNSMIRKLVSEDIVVNSTIFRIMTGHVADSVKKLREQNRYIVGIVGWVGFDHACQDVLHGERYKGETKYTLSKQFGLAFNAIFSFSPYFLRAIIKIGLFFVLSSVAILLYVLYAKFVVKSPAAGWTSLITAILMVGGVQIVILGVIGEYIGRTYVESKQRPLYVIKEHCK